MNVLELIVNLVVAIAVAGVGFLRFSQFVQARAVIANQEDPNYSATYSKVMLWGIGIAVVLGTIIAVLLSLYVPALNVITLICTSLFYLFVLWWILVGKTDTRGNLALIGLAFPNAYLWAMSVLTLFRPKFPDFLVFGLLAILLYVALTVINYIKNPDSYKHQTVLSTQPAPPPSQPTAEASVTQATTP